MDVVITVPASPDMVDNISPNPLDVFKRNVDDCAESLGTFRGYDPFHDPYSLYLGNMPAKIILTTAFDHSKDFSKAFDKFKRALTTVSEFIFKCSYSHCMLRCLISSYDL